MFRIKFGCVAAVTALLFVLARPLSAQNLLRQPESVVYDSSHDRYLASNYSTGHIVYLDRQGNQDYFVVNQDCRNGLHIEGNIVWAACIEQGIRGFGLDSAQLVTHINIDGAINCNDITSDTSGYLYVSDVYRNMIYKIDLDDYSYSIFVINNISYPNGIYFQERYNRILLVSLIANSPIQAINLTDSTVTILIYTNRHNLDGITEDNEGNIYFSSWTTSSVYMYDSLFTNPPQFIYYNANAPADIFYDKINSVLAVPVMYSNAIVFLNTPTSVSESHLRTFPKRIAIDAIYPNPFNPLTTIAVDLERSRNLTLKVYDITGKEVSVLARGYYPAGRQTFLFDGSQFASGVYLVRLESNGFMVSQKMVLLK
jgi:hypothetical protein